MLQGLRRRAFGAFVTMHVAAYRLTGGRVGASFRGVDTLLLDHVGRRSGKRRTTPLLYVSDGDDLVIVASRGAHTSTRPGGSTCATARAPRSRWALGAAR